MKIFIGCTMMDNIDRQFKTNAHLLAAELANNGYDLVFGACNYGLMGIVYRAMKAKNRHITGIVADIYKDDLLELECDEEFVIESITERNNKFLEYAEAVIFLEGGTGTLGELFTILEAKKSSSLDIPIIIYNESGYYNNLLEMLNTMYGHNMLKEKELNNFHISNDINDCIAYLEKFKVDKKKLER